MPRAIPQVFLSALFAAAAVQAGTPRVSAPEVEWNQIDALLCLPPFAAGASCWPPVPTAPLVLAPVNLEKPRTAAEALATLDAAREAMRTADYARACRYYEGALKFSVRAPAQSPTLSPLVSTSTCAQPQAPAWLLGQLVLCKRRLGDLAAAADLSRALLWILPDDDPQAIEARVLLDVLTRAQVAGVSGAAPMVAVLDFHVRDATSTPREGAGPAAAPAMSYTAASLFLSDVTRASAAERGLQVMTRENISVLLRVRGHSLGDCVGCSEVEAGRLLGADFVVGGELLEIGGELRLSVKLHETATGRFVVGVFARGKTPAALEDDLRDKLPQLLARSGSVAQGL